METKQLEEKSLWQLAGGIKGIAKFVGYIAGGLTVYFVVTYLVGLLFVPLYIVAASFLESLPFGSFFSSLLDLFFYPLDNPFTGY